MYNSFEESSSLHANQRYTQEMKWYSSKYIDAKSRSKTKLGRPDLMKVEESRMEDHSEKTCVRKSFQFREGRLRKSKSTLNLGKEYVGSNAVDKMKVFTKLRQMIMEQERKDGPDMFIILLQLRIFELSVVGF